MRSRKYYFAVIATAFVFTGCGSKSVPVSTEPTEIIESAEEVETESEEVEEKSEPELEVEPTTEPILAEPVEEKPDLEENEDNNSDLGYEIISIDEIQMYVTTNANIRSGPSTDYDIVGGLKFET